MRILVHFYLFSTKAIFRWIVSVVMLCGTCDGQAAESPIDSAAHIYTGLAYLLSRIYDVTADTPIKCTYLKTHTHTNQMTETVSRPADLMQKQSR